MQRLLDLLEQQEQWTEVLRWSEHWIALGQVPEPAYRSLMIGHAAGGLAAAAAYERCAAALQMNIGVEPSAETQELYCRLLAGETLSVSTLSSARDGATNRALRHNLPHQSTPFVGREHELARLGKY